MNKGWYETVVWGKDSMSRRRYERKGSVGAGKALFHLSKFWLTGDVVPTVINRSAGSTDGSLLYQKGC